MCYTLHTSSCALQIWSYTLHTTYLNVLHITHLSHHISQELHITHYTPECVTHYTFYITHLEVDITKLNALHITHFALHTTHYELHITHYTLECVTHYTLWLHTTLLEWQTKHMVAGKKSKKRPWEQFKKNQKWRRIFLYIFHPKKLEKRRYYKCFFEICEKKRANF